MALLIPLESPASFWLSEQWRQMIQLRQEEYRDVSSSDLPLVFGVLNIPSLRCFPLGTFGHR